MDLPDRIAKLSPAKLSDLVQRVAKKRTPPETPDISRRATLERAPLSYSQQGIWFLEQAHPDTAAHNLLEVILLEGDLRLECLRQTLRLIIERHEVLRTSFRLCDGEPCQVIAPRIDLPLRVEILPDTLSAEFAEDSWRRIARTESLLPFDLRTGPMIRATLVRVRPRRHVLLVCMHHIVGDGWSRDIFAREFIDSYVALSQGRSPDLKPVAVQYPDFAVWQRQHFANETLDRQLEYWKQQFAHDLSRRELPVDFVRPDKRSFRGDRLHFDLAAGVVESLPRLCRLEGTTLFMTLLAAVFVLLMRFTREYNVVVGTAIANRRKIELEGTIGFFANTLALCCRLDDVASFREVLRATRTSVLGAMAHQDVPFERVVQEVRPDHTLHNNPLFQVMFLLAERRTQAARLAEITIEWLPFDAPIAPFDLSFHLEQHADGISAALEYNTELFNRATTEALAGAFRQILERACENPDVRVWEIPLQAGTLQMATRSAVDCLLRLRQATISQVIGSHGLERACLLVEPSGLDDELVTACARHGVRICVGVPVLGESTAEGRARWVPISRGSLADSAAALQETLQLQMADRVLTTFPLGSVMGLQVMSACLLAGATFILGEETAYEDPDPRRLWQSAPTVLHVPVRVWRELIFTLVVQKAQLPASLRLCVVCGGCLDSRDWELWKKAAPQATRLQSATGFAETCGVALVADFDPTSDGAMCPDGVTLGKPLSSYAASIADGALNLLPRGFPGELILARRRQAMDIFPTGLLARQCPGGAFQVWGEPQVSALYNGVHVDCRNLDSALMAHPGVACARTSVVRDHGTRDKLISWIVARGDAALTEADLRLYVESIPCRVRISDRFIMTREFVVEEDGRIAPLCTYGEIANDAGDFESPQSEVERRLAQMWSRLLGTQSPGRHANFFNLGGHSLVAARMVNELSEAFGVGISLRELFDMPTMSLLARHIEARMLESNGRMSKADSHESGPPGVPAPQILLERLNELSDEEVVQALKAME